MEKSPVAEHVEPSPIEIHLEDRLKEYGINLNRIKVFKSEDSERYSLERANRAILLDDEFPASVTMTCWLSYVGKHFFRRDVQKKDVLVYFYRRGPYEGEDNERIMISIPNFDVGAYDCYEFSVKSEGTKYYPCPQKYCFDIWTDQNRERVDKFVENCIKEFKELNTGKGRKIRRSWTEAYRKDEISRSFKHLHAYYPDNKMALDRLIDIAFTDYQKIQ